MTIKELIAAGERKRDSFATARKIMREEPDAIVGIVAAFVEHQWRCNVRTEEHAAFSISDNGTDRRAAALLALTGKPVVVERGKPPVEWQLLTRDQIQRRIAMLTAMRTGIEASIQRLLDLHALLEQHGVDRYVDIPALEPAS